MSGITLSAGIRANLLSLQNTASLMQTTQNDLATGKKVNSALDNPLEFFTSQNLNNRADSLSGLLDSMSNGIQTIQAANNGITSITSLVQQLQSVAAQAQGDTSSNTFTAGATSTLVVANQGFSNTSCIRWSDHLRTRRRRFGGRLHLFGNPGGMDPHRHSCRWF